MLKVEKYNYTYLAQPFLKVEKVEKNIKRTL
jgi:hypothetical protein